MSMKYTKPKVVNKSNELITTPKCKKYCSSKYSGGQSLCGRKFCKGYCTGYSE